MIQATTNIRVRYAETDQMGFLHHQHYVAYFEQSRVDLMDTFGVPYRSLEAAGCFMPVLSIQIEYLHPNRFDDRLEVRCFLDSLPRARIELRYEVFRGDLMTTKGVSSHAFMDNQGRPMRPPKMLVEAVRPLIGSRDEV
jgi:acyl-CoA thioester hydrolase